MSIFSYKKIVNNTTYMNNINPIATFCGLVLFANHNYVNTTILFVNTNTIVLTYDNILVQLIWLVSVLLS